jgi:hypothetical protein
VVSVSKPRLKVGSWSLKVESWRLEIEGWELKTEMDHSVKRVLVRG